jgi:peptidoglycan/LPS O-acetylase OafA/YrhL
LQVTELVLERQTRIPELDGWRAISILMVVGAHAALFRFQAWITPHPILSRFWVHAGPLGVKIFFVISGFVICRLLLIEERRNGLISLRGFYLRRAFRILPPLYLLLSVLAALQTTHWIEGNWRSLTAGGLFLTNFSWVKRYWFSEHTWSLAVEEQFYLLFPPLFLLSRSRSHWRTPFLIFLFTVLAIWNLWRIIALGADPLHQALVSHDTRAGFSCICTGVLMAVWEGRARRFATRVPAWIILLAGAVLLAHPLRRDTAAEALFESLFIPVAIGLILIWSLERGRSMRSLLCSRPCQAVGLTSYGIYLWQQLFLGRSGGYLGKGAVISDLWPLLAVIVPISYFALERPSMRFGKSLSSRIRQRGVPAG